MNKIEKKLDIITKGPHTDNTLKLYLHHTINTLKVYI